MLSKQIIVEIYNSEQKYWWILIEVLETNEIDHVGRLGWEGKKVEKYIGFEGEKKRCKS